MSSRSNLAHPAPSARRSAMISCPATSSARGTRSLRTAGVPSSSIASATKASVESSYVRPTLIDHRCSRSATSSGRSSSHPSAPTAIALLRTTSRRPTTTRLSHHRRAGPTVRLNRSHVTVVVSEERDADEPELAAAARQLVALVTSELEQECASGSQPAHCLVRCADQGLGPALAAVEGAAGFKAQYVPGQQMQRVTRYIGHDS